MTTTDEPDTLVDELGEVLAVVVVLVLVVSAILHLAPHLEQVTVLIQVRPVDMECSQRRPHMMHIGGYSSSLNRYQRLI